ncbi:MAG: ABC transporter ATP-binding protein [bacterium]|nr:ABC transporter ATP-binding protein [bacterium]
MDDAPKKKYATSGQVLRTYYRSVIRYPSFIFLVFLGVVGLQVADLAAPWYLKEFFNVLASKTPSAALVSQLFGIIVIIALIWLASWAMRRLQDFSNIYLEARVMTNLFSNAFEYLIGHSYNFFTSNFAGSLTHRVSKFARAFEVMFDAIALQFFPTFLFVCGAVTVLFLRNPILGIALGVWSVLFMAFQIYVAKLRQPVRAARAEADTRITGTLADAISNHPTIMLFSGSRHELGLFKGVVNIWRKATLRSWLADNWIWSGIGFFMIAIEVLLLWVATIYWGKGMLTIGDFVLIQAYLMTTFDRLVSINRELRRFYDALADSSEMVYILEQKHDVRDPEGAPPLKVKNGEIEFKDVQFSFSSAPLLSGLNLQIKSKEKVGLVGHSGAGKSTITKLLLRMFDIKGGSIAIDGQNISKVTQDSLREAVAFVPQEPVLFHRPLMENIRYGRRDATDEEVIEAAKKAHCHEFISNLNQGYGTYVGERGIKLSGGERQRVAIARAILKNAPILLLDEATSSLDSESEALIQDALETLMKDKTVIVIAHRLSTIMKMDRIIVLEKGSIVAEGTHQQLLEDKGLYQKLWKIQAGGFREEPEPEELDATLIEAEEEAGRDDEEKEPMPKMK